MQRMTQKYIEQHKNLEECGPCPVFAGFTLRRKADDAHLSCEEKNVNVGGPHSASAKYEY